MGEMESVPIYLSASIWPVLGLDGIVNLMLDVEEKANVGTAHRPFNVALY
jgi:hypothetical protein